MSFGRFMSQDMYLQRQNKIVRREITLNMKYEMRFYKRKTTLLDLTLIYYMYVTSMTFADFKVLL